MFAFKFQQNNDKIHSTQYHIRAVNYKHYSIRLKKTVSLQCTFEFTHL